MGRKGEIKRRACKPGGIVRRRNIKMVNIRDIMQKPILTKKYPCYK